MSDSLPTVDVPVELGRNGKSSLLSYREAREAPCLSCETSPCCTHLLLSDFQLDSLIQVDHALYLLNFEGIVLGFGRDQKVDVYLHQPCVYLDPSNALCTVHSTPVQPAVCVQYSGHSCAYRTRMVGEVDAERPLMDYQRMKWLAEHIVYDDNRRVAATPDWAEMLEAFGTMPRERHPLPAPPPDPVLEEWRSIVLSEKPAAEPGRTLNYNDPEVTNPCHGCEAWCCKFLVFNRGMPTDASQLEFLRYCLGFPGVEIGVADDSWAVIVHTTCRHLDGNRCSVYGTDDRPLKCGYYDALSCGYRGHFGVPQPKDILRVSRDQFPRVAESIIFDDMGEIVAVPPLELLRQRVEELVRAEAGVG